MPSGPGHGSSGRLTGSSRPALGISPRCSGVRFFVGFRGCGGRSLSAWMILGVLAISRGGRILRGRLRFGTLFVRWRGGVDVGFTRTKLIALAPRQPPFVCGPRLPGHKDYGYPRACRPVAAHSHQDHLSSYPRIRTVLVGAMQQRSRSSPLIPIGRTLVVVSLLVSTPTPNH